MAIFYKRCERVVAVAVDLKFWKDQHFKITKLTSNDKVMKYLRMMNEYKPINLHVLDELLDVYNLMLMGGNICCYSIGVAYWMPYLLDDGSINKNGNMGFYVKTSWCYICFFLPSDDYALLLYRIEFIFIC